jgi:hypothetical protein
MGCFPAKTKSCYTNFAREPDGSPSAPAPNPDPSRWELLDIFHGKKAHAIKVLYRDCTNFEGVKIMVFLGHFKHHGSLDPHFSEESNSPVARFIPNEWGWNQAILLVHELDTLNNGLLVVNELDTSNNELQGTTESIIKISEDFRNYKKALAEKNKIISEMEKVIKAFSKKNVSDVIIDYQAEWGNDFDDGPNEHTLA